jgi:hypothetical protein
LVEPFVPHPQDTEYYININSVREVRLFLFFFSLVAFLVFSFVFVRGPGQGVQRTMLAFGDCSRAKAIFAHGYFRGLLQRK